jgi:hypothetical protein
MTMKTMRNLTLLALLMLAATLTRAVEPAESPAAVNGLRLTLIEKPAKPPGNAGFGAVPPKALFLHWENVGKGVLSLERDRCCDLFGHVFVKGSDGTFAPRAPRFPLKQHAGTVWSGIEGGKSDEEMFNPWHWVRKPMKPGKYEVWVEFEMELKERAKAPGGVWVGKIVSNHLEIEVKEGYASLMDYPNAVLSATDAATGITVMVEPNGQELMAVNKDGVGLWQVDLLKKWGNPHKGSAVIRHLAIREGRVDVTIGKSMGGTVDLKTGEAKLIGED